MNRLLVWAHECDLQRRVRLTGRRADHLRGVLRVKTGDTVRAGVINGPGAQAMVLEVGEEHCDVQLRDEPVPTLPPPPGLDVLLAMPRPRFLKQLLPQLATLGLRRLYLVSACRVERFYFDTHWLRPEHYLPLVIEGMEQAMDTRLPEIRVVRPMRRFLCDELASRYAPGHRLLAHPGPRSSLHEIPPAGQPLLVAVGPEGGWTAGEVAMFEEQGFNRFSLGPRILRTDMACVALLSLFDYLRPPPTSRSEPETGESS